MFGLIPVSSGFAVGFTVEQERFPVFRSRASGHTFGGLMASFGTGFGADNELELWVALGGGSSTVGCSGGAAGQGGVRVGRRFFSRTMLALSISATKGFESQFCDAGAPVGAAPLSEVREATLLAVDFVYDLIPSKVPAAGR